jgi:hypothetical protein
MGVTSNTNPSTVSALLFTVIFLQAGGHKQQGFNIPFVGFPRSDPQRLGLPGVNLFHLKILLQ